MVADTYSSRIGAILQGTGNNNNSWGVSLNAGLQVVDDAIAGNLNSAVTGGTLDLSGSPPPAGPSLARYALLRFTGTLVSAQTVIVPNLHKIWIIENSAGPDFALLIKTPSGAAVDIPYGSIKTIYCNGADSIVRTDHYEVGRIDFIAGTSVPFGSLECDGSAVSRARYVSLFNRIGTTWGAGDGVTTFNLPNLTNTGRFLRSRTGSVPLGTYQANQNLSHTHTGTVSVSGTTAGGGSHNHTGTTNGGSAHTHGLHATKTSTPPGSAFTTPATDVAWSEFSGNSLGVTDSESSHTHTFTTSTQANHTHTYSGSHGFTSDASGGTEARPEAAVMIAVIRI